jgi:hypothetical protein
MSSWGGAVKGSLAAANQLAGLFKFKGVVAELVINRL